ncbi:MAG: beta-lactamase family protein, partial [Myxococcales bacterium]|nr:beta-lactamase family protein [Myxococcales bacterium]
TIRHVLTHRAGIPSLGPPHNDVENLLHWDKVVRLLCEAKPATRPGRKLAYHAITGGFVLGEIVRRVTGRTIRDYLHDEVLGPLGFEGMNYGWPAERLHEVAVNHHTGPTVPWPLSLIVERALSVPWADAVNISNDPRYLSSIVPAGNIVATAREVARFYELLLNHGELDGTRVFDRRTIRRAVNESSYLELDLTLVLPVRYGLGVMLGSDRVSPFGPRTPRAFGHLGFIQIITWADPDRHLAGALLTSGKPWLGPDLGALWRVLATINRVCEGRPKAVAVPRAVA